MRHTPLRSALALAAVSLTPVPGQEAFKANHFLPNEYENIVQVNLKALRHAGIWDELESGLMKVFLGQLEQEAGFSLRALDRMTVVPMMPELGAEGMASKEQQVFVLEGNTELAVPNSVARGSYSSESIGIYDVRRRTGYMDEVFFQPRPEVQIFGSTDLLRPMLEGRPSAGMPCPDIMSLTAGHGDALLHVVVHVADETLNKRMVPTLFPDTEWPADDRMQFMMLRLSAVGDPDDPNLEAELVIRHGKNGEGLNVSEKAVAGLIERVGKEPKLRLVAPLLEGIVTKRDRTDLSLRLDLGTGRTAAGRLTMLVLPMMMLGTTVEQAVEVAEVVEEPPPPPPPEPGKKKL